jgi:DNA-binding NarL/FixJ family response regulator
VQLVLIAPPGLLRDTLARSLTALGHEVTVHQAAGKPSQSTLLRARLIILDMESADSETLLAELPICTEAPIVALVPTTNHRLIATIPALGAAGWIAKTFSEAQMLNALRRVLSDSGPNIITDVVEKAKPFTDLTLARGNERPYDLTASELDALRLLAEGLTNLQIADRRNTTEGTVKVHLDRVYKKLRVQNRAQAILLAKRMPLIGDLQIQRMEQEGFQIEWLLPYTEAKIVGPGEVLFHKGDDGDALYFIERGCVQLLELGVRLTDGSVLGEIGIFAPEHRRTATARCEVDTRLLRVGAEQARRLYVENPHFAYHVLRLICSRLIADRVRADAH